VGVPRTIRYRVIGCPPEAGIARTGLAASGEFRK
jgi:hypothetical protein